MQCANLSTSDFRGEEKSNGICTKTSPLPRGLDPAGSAFRQLLAASKEAEVLIACLFELHSITAAPLEQIWDKLSLAIEAAQQSLQAQH